MSPEIGIERLQVIPLPPFDAGVADQGFQAFFGGGIALAVGSEPFQGGVDHYQVALGLEDL